MKRGKALTSWTAGCPHWLWTHEHSVWATGSELLLSSFICELPGSGKRLFGSWNGGCCVTTFSWGKKKVYNHLLTPDREPTTDQNVDTTKVHSTRWARKFYWSHLQGKGWGVTYRTRNDLMTNTLLRPTEGVTGHTRSTLHTLQAIQKFGDVLSKWPNLSQTPWLVSPPSGKMAWS